MRLVIRLLALSLAFASSAVGVTMDWTPVGNPGNECDPHVQGCIGAVGYAYHIGTYEVTNTQYAEFLNAKAADDPLALFDPNMGRVTAASPAPAVRGASATARSRGVRTCPSTTYRSSTPCGSQTG